MRKYLLRVAVIVVTIALAAPAMTTELPPVEPNFVYRVYFSESASEAAPVGLNQFARALAAQVNKNGHRCDTLNRFHDLVYLGAGHATIYCNEGRYIYVLSPVETRTGVPKGGFSIQRIK